MGRQEDLEKETWGWVGIVAYEVREGRLGGRPWDTVTCLRETVCGCSGTTESETPFWVGTYSGSVKTDMVYKVGLFHQSEVQRREPPRPGGRTGPLTYKKG